MMMASHFAPSAQERQYPYSRGAEGLAYDDHPTAAPLLWPQVHRPSQAQPEDRPQGHGLELPLRLPPAPEPGFLSSTLARQHPVSQMLHRRMVPEQVSLKTEQHPYQVPAGGETWVRRETVGPPSLQGGSEHAEEKDTPWQAGTNFLPSGGSLKGDVISGSQSIGGQAGLLSKQGWSVYGPLEGLPGPSSSAFVEAAFPSTLEPSGIGRPGGPRTSRTASGRPPRKGQILHRNKACLSCRAKKTKCDALKPVCTSCRKLGVESECHYDRPPKWLEAVTRGARQAREGRATVDPTGAATGSGKGSVSEEDSDECGGFDEEENASLRPNGEDDEASKVLALQRKIEELQERLRNVKVSNAMAVEVERVTAIPTARLSTPGEPRRADRTGSLSVLPSRFVSSAGLSGEVTPSASTYGSRDPSPKDGDLGDSSDSSTSCGSSRSPRSHNDASSKTSTSNDHPVTAKSGGPDVGPSALSEPAWEPDRMDPAAEALLEDGWPRTLPARRTCRLILKAFFNRPLAPYMIMDTSKLLTRLHLPPSHPFFPEVSLLHAILAIGTAEVSREALGPRPYWSRAAGGPAEYHAQWADKLMWEALAHERNPRALHEHAQAAVVLGQWYQTKGMALCLWKSLGYALRVCTMLGYAESGMWNTSRRKDWDDGVEDIGPPVDAVDAYERSTLFWYAMACERVCCAVAGFAVSTDEADVFGPITSLHPNVPTWQAHHPHADEFFFCHEEDVTGSLQLLTKSSILVGRVTVFLQRANHPATEPAEIDAGRNKLASTIKRFFDSFPAPYKAPIQIDSTGRIDPCLLSVHCQVHALVIHLHEGAVKMSLQDPDFVACANSARILMGWFHQVGNLNLDIGTFLCANPTMTFALILALRTSVRMIAMNEAFGCYDAAAILRDDLERVMTRLRASSHLPMGGRQIDVIADLMRDPSVLLPQMSDIRTNASFIRSLRSS